MPTLLLSKLLSVHPRALQVIRHVAFEGGSVDSLAQKYGVPRLAAARMLARSLEALNGGKPRHDDTEDPFATLKQFDTLLSVLTTHRAVLVSGLADAERAEANRPLRRWEGVLRWVAIIAIGAMALYSYLDERHRGTQGSKGAPANGR